MIRSGLCCSPLLHPLALKIEAEFPNLGLVRLGVHRVFELIQKEGPARGLHLNVKITIGGQAEPFRILSQLTERGVKLPGAPIGLAKE